MKEMIVVEVKKIGKDGAFAGEKRWFHAFSQVDERNGVSREGSQVNVNDLASAQGIVRCTRGTTELRHIGRNPQGPQAAVKKEDYSPPTERVGRERGDEVLVGLPNRKSTPART
jgi:hypothetical protein